MLRSEVIESLPQTSSNHLLPAPLSDWPTIIEDGLLEPNQLLCGTCDHCIHTASRGSCDGSQHPASPHLINVLVLSVQPERAIQLVQTQQGWWWWWWWCVHVCVCAVVHKVFILFVLVQSQRSQFPMQWFCPRTHVHLLQPQPRGNQLITGLWHSLDQLIVVILVSDCCPASHSHHDPTSRSHHDPTSRSHTTIPPLVPTSMSSSRRGWCGHTGRHRDGPHPSGYAGWDHTGC